MSKKKQTNLSIKALIENMAMPFLILSFSIVTLIVSGERIDLGYEYTKLYKVARNVIDDYEAARYAALIFSVIALPLLSVPIASVKTLQSRQKDINKLPTPIYCLIFFGLLFSILGFA